MLVYRIERIQKRERKASAAWYTLLTNRWPWRKEIPRSVVPFCLSRSWGSVALSHRNAILYDVFTSFVPPLQIRVEIKDHN
jgi:hypothetical protein